MLSPPFVQLIFHNCMYCTNGPCLVETANTRSLVPACVGNDGNGTQAIAPTSLPTFNKKRVPFSSDAESPVLANVEEVEEGEEVEEDEVDEEDEEDEEGGSLSAWYVTVVSCPVLLTNKLFSAWFAISIGAVACAPAVDHCSP